MTVKNQIVLLKINLKKKPTVHRQLLFINKHFNGYIFVLTETIIPTVTIWWIKSIIDLSQKI